MTDSDAHPAPQTPAGSGPNGRTEARGHAEVAGGALV